MRLLNDILVNAKYDYFHMWDNAICLAYRGSIAHDTYIPNNTPSSIDDKDILGIAIPPKEYFFSLKEFQQYEIKHEYWDVVIYDFKKFVKLLMKSNPNVMQLLWTPKDLFLKQSWQFEELIKNKHIFISKGIYNSFCGYSQNQLYILLYQPKT